MSVPSDAELLRRAYEEVQRLRAELARVTPECVGCLHQGGPLEECPLHGREYAYWVDGCTELSEQVGRLRAELVTSRKLSSMYYRRAVEAADRSGDAAWVQEHEAYEDATAAQGVAMAEVERLRAELAQVNGNYHACRDYLTDDFDRANKAEAAIARVRELCAGHLKGDLGDYVQTARVLATLEGEQT